MGLMDKVKEQAEKAKEQAKDLKTKVGDKVEDVQAKRHADELLADLGRITYGRQTGRTQADADAETERVVAELKKLEDDGTRILTP